MWMVPVRPERERKDRPDLILPDHYSMITPQYLPQYSNWGDGGGREGEGGGGS